tara:strand:- start:3811 stop:4422 length:612 start_codon:yes stop_codon:yes gene_type:complete
LNNTILHYCKIEKNSVILNNKLIITKNEEISFSEFSKLLYSKIKLNYPKFFKMDNLSKLALITSEYLLSNYYNKVEKSNNISIILSNKSSSLITDRDFQKTIDNKDNYFPSPSLFVYTLPNISIGEICIKNNITGENIFFITENFNPKLINEYASTIINNHNKEIILCGWVDFDEDNFKAFMYIASINNINEISVTDIDKLFK